MSKKNANRANNVRQMRASNGRFCKASEVSTTAEPARNAEFSQEELDKTYKAMNEAKAERAEQHIEPADCKQHEEEPLSEYFIDDEMTAREKVGCMFACIMVFVFFALIVGAILHLVKYLALV